MRFAAIVMTGCSFFAVEKPAEPPLPPGPCTTSRAAPVADTVVAVGAGVVAVLGLVVLSAASNSHGDSNTIGTALGALMLVPSVPILVIDGSSAHYGFHHTARCRELTGR